MVLAWGIYALKVVWGGPKVGDEELKSVREALMEGWISGSFRSPYVGQLEKEFAETVNVKYAIAVCNGTCALIASLLSLKHLFGELTISLPTWTFISTYTAAKLIGREIHLVDSLKSTFNINYNKIDVSDTNVIMPVDVGGVPCDYNEIRDLRKIVLADSAEALGAEYNGTKLGGIADITCFSFHATKVVTCGEGGVITTNNSKYAKIIRQIINQGYREGRRVEYIHEIEGYNFRLNSLSSALALAQLRKLNEHLKHRRGIARIYQDICSCPSVERQLVPLDRTSGHFVFTILVQAEKREKIVKNLLDEDIEVRVWRPVHLQPFFKDKENHPVAEELYRRNIQLPITNTISEEQAKYVAEKVKKHLK